MASRPRELIEDIVFALCVFAIIVAGIFWFLTHAAFSRPRSFFNSLLRPRLFVARATASLALGSNVASP
jgi:hypothetical protein